MITINEANIFLIITYFTVKLIIVEINPHNFLVIIIMYFYSASIQLPAQERFYE